MTELSEPDYGIEEPGSHPAGTGRAGPLARVAKSERRRTVKRKKSKGGTRKASKQKAKVNAKKAAGRNVTAGVTEAARILREWGYIVGKVTDPDLPFNLIAHRGREHMSILVIRPREPVMNAAGVRAYHSQEVLELQPFWNSDVDNIQFWLFSRAAGLLRYRVFRGGIWNVETMQEGWQEKRAATADVKTGAKDQAVQKSRTAHGPVLITGHGEALD
jgi:hypothetical protein